MWTIFFHRLFGPITPGTGEFHDVTYPTATNVPDVERIIGARVSSVVLQYLLGPEPQFSHIIIKFLDRVKKKSTWFGKDDDYKTWEVWVINVKTESQDLKTSVQSFEDNLLTIINIADSHKDHIPPITSLELSPFPYTIEVQPDVSTENASWGKYIKRVLE